MKGMKLKIIITKRTAGSPRRVQCETVGPSMTEKSHEGATDINKIMAKAMKTGLMKQRIDQPQYGDFSGALAYQEAVEKVREADKDFMLLPAQVRSRFDNDPAMLLEFVNDPENRQEAVELGIFNPEPRKKAPVAGPVEQAPADVAETGSPEREITAK